MSAEFSVCRCDVYATDGSFDTTLYEVRASNPEFIQDIQLESTDELVALRDALNHYIDTNNLDQPTLTDTAHEH